MNFLQAELLYLMNYFRPSHLPEALDWLAQNNAGIAAGCTDLFAMTGSAHLEKSGYENLLDVTGLDELKGITETGEGYRIGAATSWREIINSELPPSFDGLKAAAREVGSVQIQNSGTIGGNLCNASPAADGVPPLLTLDASVEVISTTQTRTLPLSEFLLGVRKTALQADELLSAILIPHSATNGISNFKKLGARKYLVISIAMVAVRLEIEKDTIRNIAISVGSCSAVATRLSALEEAIRGKSIDLNLSDVIGENEIAAALAPIDDIRADSAYRLTAAREIILRSVSELLGGALEQA